MILPPPQRLPKAEFDALIKGSVKESIQTFSQLAGLPPSGDACVPEQYIRIVQMMYDQLDARKIPHGRIKKDFAVEDLDIAFASLVGLGVTLPIWLNHDDLWKELVNGLTEHWPDIRQWILFLYRSIVTQQDLDTALRYTCKGAIVEFLGLLRDRLLFPWSKTITTDRQIMKMICDLWFIETRDPLFSSWSLKANTQRESAIFNACFLIAHEMGTTIDCGNLLSLFKGEPEAIATVTLCHLDHEISRENEWDLNCIAWDLHIATALSLQADIRVALMRQGMIKAASEILEFTVSRKWEGGARVLAARCMVNAIVILRSRVEEMDGLPFLVQVLQRGLVESLLKCETLMQFAEHPPAHREPVMLLGDILPGYTVYRSVLYLTVVAIDAAVRQRLDAKLSRDEELYMAWMRLKDVVDERRGLVRRGVQVPNGHMIQTCQNSECSKTRDMDMDRFKRCAGCLHAYYCSRKCQRYDWQFGNHKQYCTRIHERSVRTKGEMGTVHRKDLKFLNQVILAELRKYRHRLSAHPSKLTLVELNLVGGQVSTIFDPRGTSANPFGTKCECETFANARLKRMAEAVREGKTQTVLVRAFIPGGLSRKIVLQAIPLDVVVNDGKGRRKNDRGVVKYLFNMIFTCCGSEGSDLNGPR